MSRKIVENQKFATMVTLRHTSLYWCTFWYVVHNVHANVGQLCLKIHSTLLTYLKAKYLVSRPHQAKSV